MCVYKYINRLYTNKVCHPWNLNTMVSQQKMRDTLSLCAMLLQSPDAADTSSQALITGESNPWRWEWHSMWTFKKQVMDLENLMERVPIKGHHYFSLGNSLFNHFNPSNPGAPSFFKTNVQNRWLLHSPRFNHRVPCGLPHPMSTCGFVNRVESSSLRRWSLCMAKMIGAEIRPNFRAVCMPTVPGRGKWEWQIHGEKITHHTCLYGDYTKLTDWECFVTPQIIFLEYFNETMGLWNLGVVPGE